MSKPYFTVGQKVVLGDEKYKVISTGLTVRGGHDAIGPPGVYGTVKLRHLASGKEINWLAVLLKKRIEEEKKSKGVKINERKR